MNKREILIVGIVVEGALALIFFLWAWARQFEDRLLPNVADISFGVLYAVLLCALNLVLMTAAARKFELLAPLARFVDEIIKPLADSLDWQAAIVISLCAGIGEELFFRGVLQNELGITAASLLFALLHFGAAVRQYLTVAALYAVIGFVFGYVYLLHGSLWVPIIMHVVYDFLALIYMRRFYNSHA